jgi:hypothetical protein
MSNRTIVSGLVLFGILLCGALVYGLLGGRAVQIDKYSDIDWPAKIYPDYSSTVIPPNIAPLNFLVQEAGSYYLARIYSDKGEAIEVSGRSPKILIPVGRWHELLDKNRQGLLHFDIFVRKDKHRWVRYRTITSKIAGEDIDGFLVYRRMHQTHTPINGRIGIFQRNLSNFDELLVLDNRHYMLGCVNCHSFCQKRPGEALLGVREDDYFTLFIEKDRVSKIRTKLGYTTWHPSGRLAAFSIDNLPIFFHSAGKEFLDTVDLNSALAYFVVDSKTVRTSPEISRQDRLETWPNWSADGRYLYFCSSPLTWPGNTAVIPEGFDKIKYDLVRISYDIEDDKWGEVETVLSAQDTGLSISMPRTSPDGRWLMFCMCNYGYFTPWQPSSDLYIMDLEAAKASGHYEYRRLDINSDESEAWHSWSSNSRWFVFSSKREHGGFTRSYISYVDETGMVYKPLVLPQKDPEFYSYCLDAFNTPEFATVPMAAAGERLSRVALGSEGISVKMPITMATPKADVAPERDDVRQ